MSAIDYVLGKDVGRSEAKVAADIATAAAEKRRLKAQQTANALADALEDTREQLYKMRDRFVRERQERGAWQKAANYRKLMLMETFGMTAEQIYAEQHRMEKDEKIRESTHAFIDKESAEIDQDMGLK